MKNTITVVVATLILSFVVLYTLRPNSPTITVAPSPQKTEPHRIIIVATTNENAKLSQPPTTKTNPTLQYLKEYNGKSLAYSADRTTTFYYLPPRDYSAVKSAIFAVIEAYPSAKQYFSIIGDPDAGMKNFNYCDVYRTDPIQFANSCGNDLNFFEAYAFANFQTPYTMIILINPTTTHVAYALTDRVYDVFKTYNYTDYLTRVIYMYAPTTVYIAVFDTDTLSLTGIQPETNVKPLPIEATGKIDEKTITVVEHGNYFLLKWGDETITRENDTFIYNGATLNYYPVNITKVSPIDPVIVNANNTNYLYINGETYTLVPTSNNTAGDITIVYYEAFNNTPAGSITITYYG